MDEEERTMARSAKAAGAKADDAAEGIETAINNGAETFKANVEKALATYDRLYGYGKDTVAACGKAANAAGKGAETLHDEIYAYSKQTFGDSIAAAKTLMGTKSVQEAFDVQSDFAKRAFDAYVAEISKLSEIAVAAAKETFEPLRGRVQAWVDTVQSARLS